MSDPIEVAYLLTASTAVAMNAAIAVADLLPAQFVLANSSEVGVPRSWLPLLAALKGLGVAGLLVGMVAAPVLASAASAGLTAFYLVAVGAHLRAGVLHNIAYPCAFLGVAAASLALGVGVR